MTGPSAIPTPPPHRHTAERAPAPAPDTRLSREERERYSRHVLLPECGIEGQKKLKAARVLIVGTGGLGSPVALYLAAAGVGTLGLVDGDRVDLTNLPRQILHGTEDVGRPKLESAWTQIQRLNPHVAATLHATYLCADNARDLISAYDVVVDCTDNFPARYLINDACVMLGKPCVHGSIYRLEGQAAVFWAPQGPCYRCVYPEPPPPGLAPSCAEAGVIGVLPGLIGMVQATETIKLITGIGQPLIGRLLLYHAGEMSFREMSVPRDPSCPVCGAHPTITELIDTVPACASPAAHTPSGGAHEMTPEALHALLATGQRVTLLDVRDVYEYDLCRLPNTVLIPLGELAERVGELNRGDPVVVCCRSGPRGARAVDVLKAAGFSTVHNLSGGLMAWADAIDPDMPRY